MPRRVGYSEFRDFCRCPLLHFRKHREKKPERISSAREGLRHLGTLVQKAVETFYREELWRKPDPLEALRDALSRGLSTIPAGYHYVAGEADVMLPGIVRTMREERLIGARTAVEYRMNYVVEGVFIECGADLIVAAPSMPLALVDGKAGSTFDLNQLRVYALAMRGTEWGPPGRIGTWSYRKGAVSWLKQLPGAKFQAALAARMKRYIEGSQTPKLGSHCSSCGYQEECPAYRLRVRNRQALAPDINNGVVSLEG